MPLITCPDCQAEISDAAPACPRCGRPSTVAVARKKPRPKEEDPPEDDGVSTETRDLKERMRRVRKAREADPTVSQLADHYLSEDQDRGRGRYEPRRRGGSRSLFTTLLALAIIGGVAFAYYRPDLEHSHSAATTDDAPITVTAKQLYADYHANEVTADEEYKKRNLLVTGTVTSIEKDAFDNIILWLGVGDSYGLNHVMATLKDSEKSKAMSLSKGTQVTLLCKGGSMVIGSPTLRDCRLE